MYADVLPVSWSWGSGQPGGKVAEVKEHGEIAIESHRGNTIKKNADPARRAVMLDAYGQAEVPLIRAVNDGHRFVYDELLEHAAVAEKRVDALLMRIDSGQVGR